MMVKVTQTRIKMQSPLLSITKASLNETDLTPDCMPMPEVLDTVCKTAVISLYSTGMAGIKKKILVVTFAHNVQQ